MKKYLPIVFLISIFLIFKISNLDIRLSDSNIYFYTGYKLLQGEVLYRDIFFTNFPFLPYLSSLYFLLTGGSLNVFFFIPALEVSTTAFFIYIIAIKKFGNKYLALVSSALYLFSFIILSTSDHQTGVFFASLVSVLSYYFYLHKRFVLSGVFIALAILTKAYYLPILLAFLTVFAWDKKWKELGRFFIGLVVVSFVIMLPTFLFAFPEFIKNVFEYSLTRSQGAEKNAIVWFFITHDFLLFVLLLFSLLTIKKNRLFGLISLYGILLFFAYKHVYYLYLNFLIPFLALSFPVFYKTVQRSFSLQKAMIVTILAPFMLYGISVYISGFRDLQKIHITEVANAIREENPKVLYGVDDITSALSYSTGVPLLNGIIDTNSNIYRKGILSAEEMTANAISQKALIIAHGAFYPQAGVEEIVTDEIFDREQIDKSCKLIESFPVRTEGAENRLNLLRCY